MKVRPPHWVIDRISVLHEVLLRVSVRKGRAEGMFSRAPLTAGEQLAYCQRRASWLRRQLRKNPAWINGHLQFALVELEKNLVSDTKRHPRSIASISLSASALRSLCSEPQSAQLCALACYLEGMCSFLQQDYEKTLADFEILLKEQNALPADMRNRLLEYAAAACLALGASEAARKFLEQIPAEMRNAEVLSGLGYLEEFGKAAE